MSKAKAKKKTSKKVDRKDEWEEIDNMESVLYCCAGLDVHRDIIEGCIVRGGNRETGGEEEYIWDDTGRITGNG